MVKPVSLCTAYSILRKLYLKIQNIEEQSGPHAIRNEPAISATLNVIYGESRFAREELLSSSYPSFYAESESVNNSYQWRRPLGPFNDLVHPFPLKWYFQGPFNSLEHWSALMPTLKK